MTSRPDRARYGVDLCAFGIALSAGLAPPVAGAAAAAQPAPTAGGLPAAVQRPTIGSLTIDRYQILDWRPETNYFRSPGPVRLTLTDALTHEPTVLMAEDAEGSAAGKISVQGRLQMVRREGWIEGRSLVFDPAAQTGSVSKARVAVGGHTITGDRIELLGPRSFRATNATLTSCHADNPDYRISARELSFTRNGTVKARSVSFWAGRSRLFSLPTFTRSFRRTVASPIPLPTYSKDAGVQFRLSHEAINQPSSLLEYDIVLAARKPLQGTVSFERDLGRPSADTEAPNTRQAALRDPLQSPLAAHPALLREAELPDVGPPRTTVYMLASANSFVYNPRRTDLQVSRLPEAGIVAHNILGRRRTSTTGSDADAPTLVSSDWLVNAELGVGSVRERPMNRTTTRASLHAEAVSPLAVLAGPLRVRWGGSLWVSGYGSGDSYSLLAPETEVEWLIRPNTAVGAGYRYMLASGTTPFAFDARPMRHELRLRYAFLGARWGYGFDLDCDLERRRAYDTGVSVRPRFDCVEIGLAYRTRAQSLGVILNLLPGRRNPPPQPLVGP